MKVFPFFAFSLMMSCSITSVHALSDSAPETVSTILITTSGDCSKINNVINVPYCQAAFLAAQAMEQSLAQSLHATPDPTQSYFYFYQTTGSTDSPDQTLLPCTQIGGGAGLCNLIAYSMSAGPLPATNPPLVLRNFPAYFLFLSTPGSASKFNAFQSTNSATQTLIEDLGQQGYTQFTNLYPNLSQPYNPDLISGGGGGGWGAEIEVMASNFNQVKTLFTYGGGGGGGMTSSASNISLGSGGGGGAQFGNNFPLHHGLGLGGGMGNTDQAPQLSYYSSPTASSSTYQQGLINNYTNSISHLNSLLQQGYQGGDSIILVGGGGMGGGAEYLQASGAEITPHALSTQGGFQFRYVFKQSKDADNPVDQGLLDTQTQVNSEIYKIIGVSYQQANAMAYTACGNSYNNFACICPKAHALVLCLLAKQVGPTQVPAWLQQPHCGTNAANQQYGAQTASPFSPYQQSLIDAANTPGLMVTTDTSSQAMQCSQLLSTYFNTLNATGTPYVPSESNS